MLAIILAGGSGTRLRGTIGELPKPLAPVRGRPFLEYLLDYWIGQGVTRFILSVGYKHEQITAHFGPAFHGAAIRYAVEDRALGTGGGLLLALGSFTAAGPFLVVNGDTYFEVPLGALQALHAARRADATLSLFHSPPGGRYLGLEIGAMGEVLSLNAGEKGGLANGGAYLMELGLLDGGPWRPSSPLSLEDDILPFALRSGRRLFGLECGGRFLDIGVPEDYAKAAELIPERGPRYTDHEAKR